MDTKIGIQHIGPNHLSTSLKAGLCQDSASLFSWCLSLMKHFLEEIVPLR